MPHCTIRLFLLLAICMMTNGCRRESISEPKRHYVIGFSQCTNDLWRQIMMIQMQAEAAKYPELSIVVSNAHNNTQLQIDQIREFIEAKVDLLIISPNESECDTDRRRSFRHGNSDNHLGSQNTFGPLHDLHQCG